MSATVDTNILVYASNRRDPDGQATAIELLEVLAAGPHILYLFWPALLGYLRIVTHSAVLPNPLTPAEAAANVESLMERARVVPTGEGRSFWGASRDVGGTKVRGNGVPDAHLVALMHENGVETIYSRDRGFRRFDGIKVIDPFA